MLFQLNGTKKNTKYCPHHVKIVMLCYVNVMYFDIFLNSDLANLVFKGTHAHAIYHTNILHKT